MQEQLDLFGDPVGGSIDVAAELEDLALRLANVSTWSKPASHQSRGLMISLLTQAGFRGREQQLDLLKKALAITVCIASPYRTLSTRKALTQGAVNALIGWMQYPSAVETTIRPAAAEALKALDAGQAEIPVLPEQAWQAHYAETYLFA